MLFCLTFEVGVSFAAPIAVLPMEDMSSGANGVDLAMTRQVRDGLAHRGFAMISQDEVVAFMVRNRVRWLGYLGSPYIRRLHEELGVDYLLLGSVNQRREKRPFAFSITLQLIRVEDAQIIWARSAEFSGADEFGLLGLSEPQGINEVMDMVVDRALLSLPTNLHGYGRPLNIRNSIESVFLDPKIVKPGDLLQCRFKLSSPPSDLVDNKVSLFVDDRIVEAVYLEDENSFVASWPAAPKNGHIPVAVAISRLGSVDQEVLVGSYLVDGKSPEMNLNLKGQELNGIVVLQEKVDIMPVLKNPELISRWLITVRDEGGRVILDDDGLDGLPERFSWWGQASNGSLVTDGLYSVELIIWDRAGNSASAEESIRVIRQKPQMDLAMKEEANSLALSLSSDGEIPIAYWRLEIQNKDGEVISEKSGTGATGGLTLPLETVAGQDVSYRLYVQDMFGNRLQDEVTALVPVEEKKVEDDSGFLAETKGPKVALKEIWAEDF